MTRERRAEVVALDRAHVWHPYTAMDTYAKADPFVIDRAAGVWLFDADGRRYLDANGSWWVSVLGHNHPRLVGALRAQAEQLCHVSLAGTTHEPAARFAAELSEVAPAGLSRVFFSDNGSTAVEAAVKMAVQFQGQRGGAASKKRRVVALDGAFHGETVGASSLGGVEVFRRPFAGLLFDCLRVAPPFDAPAYEATWQALAELFAARGHEIAALVVEPLVQGAAGMRTYSPALLREARRLCDEHDVLLVADEVFTGFGRTGRMWACDHAGIAPDLLCLAKGLTGGLLPMGATLATERVFSGFGGGRERAFLYGHSYSGNPLGAAVGREVLRVFVDERVVERAAPQVARLRAEFDRIARRFGPGSVGLVEVTDCRSLGLAAALDLSPLKQASGTRESAEVEADIDPTGYLGEAGWAVFEAARRRGAYLRPLGDTVYVCPALTITPEELEFLLHVVEDSLAEVALGYAGHRS